LLIAKNIGAQFIRVPVFVDSVKTDYGDIFANPEAVLEYRKEINAENVAIFSDIHVKHAELLDKKTIEESAVQAMKKGSDALIVTGKWTGDAPDLKDLVAVRKAAKDFPILVGSGVDENNIKKLFEFANGAIVGTSLKKGSVQQNEVNVKTWMQRIDENKVVKLIEKVNSK
jgi:membrane complex biogenesis BtpA family protein